MNVILENALARATISDLGAELLSFVRKDTACEYMWNGDPGIWSGHAPVLFPIVCAVNSGTVKVDGVSFQIGNHGFARKSLFQVVSSAADRAEFRLRDTPDLLKMYPFPFELSLVYRLEGSKLDIAYQVRNTGKGPMYFQIGTHPGFNCPLGNSADGLAFSDFYLEFNADENLERHFMNAANVLIPAKTEKLLSGRKLPLDFSLFKDGAIVLKKVNSRQVILKSDKSERSVVLSWDNFPTMGLWTTKNASFVCIEPWHGLADEDGQVGELKDKAHIIALAPATSYQCLHTMDIR